jgi:hypothetical protein
MAGKYTSDTSMTLPAKITSILFGDVQLNTVD